MEYQHRQRSADLLDVFSGRDTGNVDCRTDLRLKRRGLGGGRSKYTSDRSGDVCRTERESVREHVYFLRRARNASWRRLLHRDVLVKFDLLGYWIGFVAKWWRLSVIG